MKALASANPESLVHVSGELNELNLKLDEIIRLMLRLVEAVERQGSGQDEEPDSG